MTEDRLPRNQPQGIETRALSRTADNPDVTFNSCPDCGVDEVPCHVRRLEIEANNKSEASD